MTIASDFYDYLMTLGDGAVVASGSPGRKLHNRIAELEEGHAQTSSFCVTIYSKGLKIMEQHAEVLARYAELQREYVKMMAEHAAMTRELAPQRLGASLAHDDAAHMEVARRKRNGEPPVSFEDIRREFEKR